MGRFSTIDFQNPATYPGARDEDWKYTPLGQALNNLRGGPRTPTRFDTLSVNDHLTQMIEDNEGGASHFQELIELDEGAHLSRLLVFNPQEEAVCLRQIKIIMKPKSQLKLVILASGAGLARLNIEVDHQGDGGICEINCAYILKNKNHFDLTTRVTHNGGDGVTTQMIKGLVKDQAIGIFQGRLIVAKGADGTDARMHHQALILNDGAKVRAKPELEIYADDVACAHGNTVGTLDEMALFFCQTRGMDRLVAKNLLMQAFLVPICENLADEAHQSKAKEWLMTKTSEILDMKT